MKMCFHQFEDHLVIADDRDSIWYSKVQLISPSAHANRSTAFGIGKRARD